MPGFGNGESEKVKIEVLYVDDCPNHQPTIERLRNVLAAEKISVPVHEVLVRTHAEAQTWHFIGSPTVRVNGNDIESVEQFRPGLSCRIYEDFSGVPSEALLRNAIAAAKENAS